MTDEMKVFWPDAHYHYQHKGAVESLLEFISLKQPDEVVILGDFLDCKAPARWSRGTADEFAADLEREAAAARDDLVRLRSLYDGKVSFLQGNHEARIATYTRSNAPALVGLVKTFGDLLDFDGFDIELQAQPYRVAPGVVAIHGDKLSQKAGESAWKELKRHGLSVVQGHSHRLGLIPDTTDRQRFALECGWLGDVRKATYLPFKGVANWQLGFGVLVTSGKDVFPTPVLMNAKGEFAWDGEKFRG